MWTIIVGDGLTKEFLSSDVEYAGRPHNVGQFEADRLLGRGKELGFGPLPLFLSSAIKAKKDGASIGMVFFERHEPAGEDATAAGDSSQSRGFVDALSDAATHAEVVKTSLLGIPWTEFGAAVARITGNDPLRGDADRDGVRFLVVGCHTEHRVLAIASFLRNVLGYTNVATCTYLTGSATPEAYYSALRHNCPSADIQVFVDLLACAEFAGIRLQTRDNLQTGACQMEPADAWAALTDEQRSIVQFLCMHWTRARIRPLQGGYSGSALLLAQGWKGQAQTEPSVLKIDRFAQMRREIDGYHQVKAHV
jgi:hypothetical protein